MVTPRNVSAAARPLGRVELVGVLANLIQSAATIAGIIFGLIALDDELGMPAPVRGTMITIALPCSLVLLGYLAQIVSALRIEPTRGFTVILLLATAAFTLALLVLIFIPSS